jgi:hypothetical protein
VLSGSPADCSGSILFEPVFAQCNAMCADAAATPAGLSSCAAMLGCLNNGGVPQSNGFCQTGACADGTPCDAEGGGSRCADRSKCTWLEGSCHTELLNNPGFGIAFEPPGPAGSSKSCTKAKQNKCKVIGLGQADCTY